MRDWKKDVRDRLLLPELKGLREERIIEEIVVQLEDFYQEARGHGLSEDKAEEEALGRIDWETLKDGLDRSERRRRRPRSVIWMETLGNRMRQWGGFWIGVANTLQDMRIALRQIRQRPGVTVAAVLCLAIATGGGAVLYTQAVATLLQPSLAEDPDRMVRIYTRWEGSEEYASVSYPDFEDLRREVETFESVVLATPVPMNLATEDRSRRVWGELVSADYFRSFGVEMVMGRTFLPEEDESEGTHPVVVISYGLWQSRFGGDPDIIGRQIHINRHPFTIIGVTEEEFYGDSVGLVMRLWVPVAMYREAAPMLSDIHIRDDHMFRSAICRLETGVTFDQAVEQVEVLRDRLAEQYPDIYTGKTFNLLPEREASLDPLVRADFKRFIFFGFVIIAFVLVLACANVAGLLLARTAGRRREIGIRMALGAGRGRLMRSLLAESATLALVAGFLAFVIAMLLHGASNSISVPMDLPLVLGSGAIIYWSDILFIFVATVIAAVLISLTPAIQASRENIASALSSGDGMQPRQATLSRRMLVTVQVAASFTLLVGSGLVLRGMQHMQDVDPGFDPQNQLLATVDLAMQGYSDDEGRIFCRELKSRLRNLPGVEAVGMALNIPLSLTAQTNACEPEGYEIPEGERLLAGVNIVDEGYFAAMGIPILEGRVFTEFDNEEAPPVIIVNEAFRDRFWPGESPIGKRVKHADVWMEVVGMVPTGKYFSLGEDPSPHYYYAFDQNYFGMMTIHIRGSEPLALVDAVRREVAELDPMLPVGELNSMAGRISFSLMPYSIATGVMFMFGLIAVLLASIGLYGLVDYFVSRQTKEIGIRMALGALNSDVLRFVVGRGMRLTFTGLAIGLVCAIGISMLARTVLPGLDSVEPLLLGIPLLLLGMIAFLASFFPAHRATRIAPVDALRIE